MLDLLQQIFGIVCGQNPEHSWAPGGVLLPFCQRCSGLYIGAGTAMLLHLTLRPRLSNRFLEWHGVFLLVMAPFGFHWVPHGPVMRTITGVLFGFGVVAFLWLQPSQAGRLQRNPAWPYALALAGMIAVLPVAAAIGGKVGAYALTGLAVWGLVVLAALVLANIGLGLAGAIGFIRARATRLRNESRRIRGITMRTP